MGKSIDPDAHRRGRDEDVLGPAPDAIADPLWRGPAQRVAERLFGQACARSSRMAPLAIPELNLRATSRTAIVDTHLHGAALAPQRPARRATEVQDPESRSSTSVLSLATGTRIERYEVIRPLANGGMSTVFLARDTKLGRLVAIKFLRAQTPDRVRRFFVEGRLTASCTHENIVVIHDTGEYRGHPYFVFEHIQGQTLREWLHCEVGTEVENRETVPIEQAIELMLPVIRALSVAHAQGIVHRDLKPENIMITPAGAVKVLDFGIAKAMDDARASEAMLGGSQQPSLEPQTALAGTLPYMSPEQWRRRDIDAQTDIWAIGIILHELLTGHHPLIPTTFDALQTVADQRVAMPSLLAMRRDLGELAALVDRCLLKDKRERLQSMDELERALEQLLPTEEVRAFDASQAPFAGLAAFQAADSNRFFGRKSEISAVIARLRNRPLVAVIGPSGSGKSSLVRAGVLPALERSAERWRPIVIRPGRTPISTLADHLYELLARERAEGMELAGSGRWSGSRVALRELVRAEPGTFGRELRAWARRRDVRVALFIDQFEELFTLVSEQTERNDFLRCLESVGDDASSPLRVILAARSDFLHHLARHEQVMDWVQRGLYFLRPMDRAALRETLIRPAEAVGYRFEPSELVDTILDDLADSSMPLPVLQSAALRLWETRDLNGLRFTSDSYVQVGGVAGALASHADAVVDGMNAADYALARSILQNLVTSEEARAIISSDDLCRLTERPDDAERVIRRLATMRLLNLETSPHDRSCTAELIHESLIKSWPRLRAWLEEKPEERKFLDELRAAARKWENSGRDPGTLWRGGAVYEARRRRMRYQSELPELEESYLRAVFELAERLARRRWYVWIAAAAVLLALAVSVWLAEQSRREAARQASWAAARSAAQSERLQAEIRRHSVAIEELNGTIRLHETAKEAEEQKREEAEKAIEDAKQAIAEVEKARQRAERALAKLRREQDLTVREMERERHAHTRTRRHLKDKIRALDEFSTTSLEDRLSERRKKVGPALLLSRGEPTPETSKQSTRDEANASHTSNR